MHVELPVLISCCFVNCSGQIFKRCQRPSHKLVLVLLNIELAELLPLNAVACPAGPQECSMEVDGRFFLPFGLAVIKGQLRECVGVRDVRVCETSEVEDSPLPIALVVCVFQLIEFLLISS